MSVGDLTVSEHARHVGISYRHIVSQELVALSRSQSRENSARGLDPDRARQHLRVRRHAHETALGERAGSPPVHTVLREPTSAGEEVHMRDPCERDERVNDEQSSSNKYSTGDLHSYAW